MTRRISKRTGRAYTVGSQASWDGFPPETRNCVVCGKRVTLNDNFQAHVEAGRRWVRHTACRTAPTP